MTPLAAALAAVGNPAGAAGDAQLELLFEAPAPTALTAPGNHARTALTALRQAEVVVLHPRRPPRPLGAR